MNGGTYAEATNTFRDNSKAGFFAGLGCSIKNYVADIMTNDNYSDYGPIGEFNMKKFMDEARDAGFTTKEVDFLERFTNETIDEAIELGHCKTKSHKKSKTIKVRIATKLREIATNMEND